MTAPVALARLEHHPHGGVWIVDDCPLCHRRHRHGGGGASEDARDFLGHRQAQCVPGGVPPDVDFAAGYVLVEAPPTAGFTSSAPQQVESHANSTALNPADSRADTPTRSRAPERACARQDAAQPDGPTGRDADREPRCGRSRATPDEERKTMSMTLTDAKAALAKLSFSNLAWIYRKAQGDKPPVGTSKATLLETMTEMFEEKAKAENGAATTELSIECETWLGEVAGDAKPAPKKAEAAATGLVSAPGKVTLEQAVAVLNGLATGKLVKVHEQVVGKPGKGLKKPVLFKAIATALQKRAEGKGASATLPPEAVVWLADAMNAKQEGRETSDTKKEPKPRDPRLPAAGTVITKLWRERTIEITVNETDFTFEGRSYRSLSAIASELLGCPANGYLWAGLTEGAKAAAARRAEREAEKAKKQAEKEQQPEPVKEKPAKSKKTTTKPKPAKGGKKAATQA